MNPLQFVREAQALVHRDEAGKLLAEAKWRRLNAHTIEVFHTHVDDSLRGQGAGSQLLDAMEKLAAQEAVILAELSAGAGKPADIGGYYAPDAEKTAKAMRPSAALNAVIDAL